MAKKKYINADEALDQELQLEVAPYASKEVVADSQGRYVGQNGLTVDDLDLVGTGQYINATDYNAMPDGYSIVNNPYQAASAEQVANRKNQSQVSTNVNDLTLMGDEAYNQILQYQQAYANAQTDAERAAAHAGAEAVRAKYGYSGGVDGSEYLGLMAYTGNQREDDGEEDYMDTSAGLIADNFDYASAPQYVNRYQQQIDALTQAILGRQPFSYDPETDPTYQQYNADYTRMGQQAMQDTLAQVAARTGGIASSYGVGASQQAFNNHMAQLASKVPELRQLAYSMYMDDLNSQRNDLNMLMGLEQSDYGKYLDQLGQWNTDRNFDYGQYRDDVADSQWQTQFDYGVSRDQMSDSQWQQQFAYQQEQDKLAQQNWQTQWDYQLEQDALARQDALNKLLSGSGGGYNSKPSSGGILETIYGMTDEAQVYDYLVSQNASASEVENYMGYWYANQEEQANAGAVDNTEGLQLLRDMERDGASVQELYDMLKELYENGLITEEAYQRRLDRYRI